MLDSRLCDRFTVNYNYILFYPLLYMFLPQARSLLYDSKICPYVTRAPIIITFSYFDYTATYYYSYVLCLSEHLIPLWSIFCCNLMLLFFGSVKFKFSALKFVNILKWFTQCKYKLFLLCFTQSKSKDFFLLDCVKLLSKIICCLLP